MSLTIYRADGTPKETDYLATPSALDTVHYIGAAGEPAFQGAWVNYDNSLASPTPGQRNMRFRKFPDGKVRITGICKSGASASLIFTLPLGYRPPVNLAAICNTANGMIGTSIYADGSVYAPSAYGAHCFFDGIEFDTETVTQWTSPVGVGPQLVTTLPTSPTDGREVYFLIDAATGSIAHVRYSAALAQWIVLNGPILLGKAVASGTACDFNVPSLTGLGLRHLRVVGKIRSTRAGFNNTGFRFRVNGDSAANYASNGYTGGAFSNVAPTTWGYMGQMPAALASELAHFTFEIPFAFDADVKRRMFVSHMGAWDNSNPIGANMGGIIGPTPAAVINRVTFMDDVGSTLDPVSEVEVYGYR